MFVLEHLILEHATIDGLSTRSITCVMCEGWVCEVCVGVRCVCGGSEEVRHPHVKGNVLDTHSLGQSSECVC